MQIITNAYQWNQRLHLSQHIMFTLVDTNVQAQQFQSFLIFWTLDIEM